MVQFIDIGGFRVAKYGSGNKIIVGIHGWAGGYTDLEVFGNWIDLDQYTLYAIEFPGRSGSKALDQYHSVDDLVDFLAMMITKLNISTCTLIADSGFSQIAIRYMHYHTSIVTGVLFLYAPLIYPKIFKLRRVLYPIIWLYAKTRMFDWLLNALRNSDWFMNKLFVDGNPPESQALARLDIVNKRKANLRAMFESAYSILNTEVVHQWQSLSTNITVIVAEHDELVDTKLGLEYIQTNKNAKVVLVKDHKHHWDEEFIRIMRNELNTVIASKARQSQ